MTGELGMRVSQMLYISTFFDAGNVWSQPSQYNPTRLFRGAGSARRSSRRSDHSASITPTVSTGSIFSDSPRPVGSCNFKLGNFF